VVEDIEEIRTELQRASFTHRDTPVSVFSAVTVEPATNPPDASLTLPNIVPVGACAFAGTIPSNAMNNSTPTNPHCKLNPPFCLNTPPPSRYLKLRPKPRFP
jgi:hypothetical protein